ncbi:hypothetical protein, partial [Thiolapillus sp.]|uniref:hypothetical protein n=1 Tax=Thiolapillus sp. TaxID=2017437 RepID=UPI003AF7547D
VGQAEKRTAISDFILDNDVDIFCVTESWLNPSGDEAKCADLAPPGYKTLLSTFFTRRRHCLRCA